MKESDMNLENIGDGEDCFLPSHPYERVKPVLDSEKQSAFYPDIEGFVSYKAEIQDKKDFWITLAMQTGFNNCTQLSVNKWSEVNQQLQLLKDLNRITYDAINFIERHELHKNRD